MARSLDLLFVSPGSRRDLYQALATTLTAIEPPVWAGMLAGWARRHGLSVDLVDAEALDWSPEQVGRAVAARDPLLTVVTAYGHQPSASTQCMTAVRETLLAIRAHAPATRTLVLGGHVSALPERTLREEPVDFVCEGEGPRTLEQLVAALRAKDTEGLAGVEGLWWEEDGTLRHNPRAANLADLDRAFPCGAWDLLPMDRYRAHNWHCFGEPGGRQPYASLYTSLGCPYRCSFCCINAPFGKAGIRYRSPAVVVEELELLAALHGVRHVKIADEMFVLNPRHVEGICDGILARGLDLNLWAYARIDTVRAGLLPKLARAGFRWLALGIESGSAHVRDGARKAFSRREIVETVRRIQGHGISVIGNYIFGLPDDTAETLEETLALALELGCEFANFYCAMAYPGSPLYALALERGWALPERWAAYSQHAFDTLPLPTATLAAGEVLRWRDDAFQRYFGSESYLSGIECKFGPAVREEVRAMARQPLPRKYAAR